jgi:hypothetical protein
MHVLSKETRMVNDLSWLPASVNGYFSPNNAVFEVYEPYKQYLKKIAAVTTPEDEPLTVAVRFDPSVRITENSDAHGGVLDFVKTMLAKTGRYPGLGIGADGASDEAFDALVETKLKASAPVIVTATMSTVEDFAWVKAALTECTRLKDVARPTAARPQPAR